MLQLLRWPNPLLAWESENRNLRCTYLSRGACRSSSHSWLGGGEVGKETEGVGGKVDISGVHRHRQQEHRNDDYTHARTHTEGREGGKQQINYAHSFAGNGGHALSSHIALNTKGELYN